MRVLVGTAVVAGCMALASQASAATIFSDGFNSYTTGNYGTQAVTGLTIGAFGTLPGWTAAGQNVVHAVQRSTGDWAVMLYGGNSAAQANVITMSSGIAANTLNALYQVSFAGAAATYATSNQGNAAGDLLRFDVLRANNSVLASYLYDPADWSTVVSSGSNPFTAGAFFYTGDGTGAVRLRVTGAAAAGRFGGALDNVAISSVPEPASWAMMIGGFGLVGANLRRRRTAVRFA